MSVDGLQVRYWVSPSDAKRLEVYRPTLRFGQVEVTPRYGDVGVDQIRSHDPEGSAWVYAAVRAFGENYQDSVRYSFSYPTALYMSIRRLGLSINVHGHRNGETITLARGARLRVWSDLSWPDNGVPDAKVSIIFDEPSNIVADDPPATDGGASGNIIDMLNSRGTSRIFATPGTYRWEITVKDVPDVLAQQRYTGVLVIK
jgi:hypothetical protein